MVVLEELGFLEKTHISSGRIPSEKGYRFYVDNLMQAKNLTGEDMLKLQTIFYNNELDLNDVIKQSLEIVSEITNYTSVVLGSTASENRLSKVEIIPLDDCKILALVITDKGLVENKQLTLPCNVDKEELSKSVELINRLLIGTPIDEINSKLEFEVKPIIGKYIKQHEIMYNAFYNAFSEFNHKQSSFLLGTGNIIKNPEFNDAEKIRKIIGKFEDDELIQSITEDKNGVNIYIGGENKIDDDVAVIKMRYKRNGEEGTIAIVGPKRMEYGRVTTLLNYIKEHIER